MTFVNWNQEIISTQTINYLQNATLPETPSRDGYAFNGWNGSFTSITANTTLIATYKVVTYSINYILNGGNSQNPSVYTIESNSFTLNNPTREGYNFLGWTGTDLNEPVQNLTIEIGSIGNRNYEANWEIILLTVNFIDYGNIEIDSQIINYGNKITAPIDPLKGNCSFDGWYIDSDYLNFLVGIITGQKLIMKIYL